MSIRRVVPIEQAEWSVAPFPEWIQKREVDWTFAPAEDAPVSFLLLDEQHHVPSQSSTYRSVRRALTLDAVRALGQVEISFDPAAYRLLIHEVTIWRPKADGSWECRSLAHRDTFLLRQREQGLEQQILNGHVSVVALLEDLRIGDAIELAWTLEPRDVLPGLRFTAYYAFVWSAPLARAFFTLHRHVGQGVRWRLHVASDAQQPVVEVTPDHATWSMERPARFIPEPNVPGGHWDFPVLDVSGWNSWAEVADFVADLWAETLTDSAEAIAAQAEALRVEGDPAASARAAIRWVQEEVRYLGVDFGHGGGVLPNPAGTVLRRRFGDCKDKSVLLVALLRALGLEACPLLVAVNWQETVANVQPSTAAFGHVIVTFMDGQARRFVDPTVVGQGGDLAHMVAPAYGFGLEVRKGCTDLITLPELSPAELTLTETFHLDRKQRDGAVHQTLRATGWFADDIRAVLVRGGRSPFFKGRAEALQTHFPALQPREEAAQVDDNGTANEVELRARYTLPTWGRVSEPPPPAFRYGAYGLFLGIEALEGPEQRRQPWLLRHPMRVNHRVVVRGRCVQKVTPALHRVSGPGFRYTCNVTSRRNEVTFEYQWETTQRKIAAADWPRYCRERTRAFEQAGANVMTPAYGVTTRQSLVWAGIVIALVGSSLAHLSSFQKQTPPPPPYTPPRPPAPLVRRTEMPSTLPLPEITIGSAQPMRVEMPTVSDRHQAERDFRTAMLATQSGDYEKAMPLLQQVYAYYAGNFDYQALRAETAMRVRNWDEADAALTAARSLQPGHPSLMWLKSLREQLRGRRTGDRLE